MKYQSSRGVAYSSWPEFGRCNSGGLYASPLPDIEVCWFAICRRRGCARASPSLDDFQLLHTHKTMISAQSATFIQARGAFFGFYLILVASELHASTSDARNSSLARVRAPAVTTSFARDQRLPDSISGRRRMFVMRLGHLDAIVSSSFSSSRPTRLNNQIHL